MPKAVESVFHGRCHCEAHDTTLETQLFKRDPYTRRLGEGLSRRKIQPPVPVYNSPALHGSALASLQFTPKEDQAGEGGFTPTSSFPARPSLTHTPPPLCFPPGRPVVSTPGSPFTTPPGPQRPRSAPQPRSLKKTLSQLQYSPAPGPAHSIAKASPPGQTPAWQKRSPPTPTSAPAEAASSLPRQSRDAFAPPTPGSQHTRPDSLSQRNRTRVTMAL